VLREDSAEADLELNRLEMEVTLLPPPLPRSLAADLLRFQNARS
jgi:hypothetical protein